MLKKNEYHHRTGRPVVTEQTSRSSAQEINTRFSLDCENTNLFVERLEKDKDTDKDVDADRDRTVRPVGGHWSPQLEEIDIDFRVPHAVVKQAENSRVRELVKKIESPFSEKSQKMIRDMGNGELLELCETIPKVQCSECLLYWTQGIVLLHLWASLERESIQPTYPPMAIGSSLNPELCL